MSNTLSTLPSFLLPWFQNNARDLPWRRDREPYHVWLSEIMLQQTRVEAVRGYYGRFLETLPTIADLAVCPEDRLLKLWEGLGYYTRVRNLQKAAQVIVTDHGGVFPSQYDEIRALPGVGDYTAGAIGSICFGLPTPAVDGNVLRVMARLRDDPSPIDQPATKKAVTALLAELYPHTDPNAMTQSLMELGAMVCVPNGPPKCDVCPVRSICLACQNGTAENLPVKAGKKPRRLEDKTVFVVDCGGEYAVEKRPKAGLLAGLWQFPNVPGHLTAQEALDQAAQWGLVPVGDLRSVTRKHIFTHVEWHMVCYYLHSATSPGPFVWADAAQFSHEVALPTAFRMFWEELHPEEVST
jgi:A/G-specific adenine glycosylase